MSEEIRDNNPFKKRQRPKRKNFLANAKKYAKKGQMGRGTKMPEELYQYFLGILDAIKAGIGDEEERAALVTNVLERTKGEELNIVGNQLGCRVIELLLPYASAEDLERFIQILSEDLRPLCSDNFTSHVVETLLKVACDRATEHLQDGAVDSTDQEIKPDDDNEEPKKKKKKKSKEKEKSEPEPEPEKSKPNSKYSPEHIQKCHEFTVKISKYALNNLEDFVWDQYANHILRRTLKCLSGITLLPGEKPKVNLFKETVHDKGIPPHLTKMEYRKVPDEFKEIVREFAQRLSSWPQFKDLPDQNLTSALLQVLLYSLKNVDKNLTKDLVKKLLSESFAPDDWSGNDGRDDKKDKKETKDSEDGEKGMENGDDEAMNGNDDLPPVFSSESSVRLLEAALFVAKKKMYTQIYAKCFINRLGRLSTVKMLNFTVQRLIDNCQIKEEFEPMFEELSDKLDAILACGNTGVLVAMAKACLRTKAKQAQFITALEKACQLTDASSQQYLSICCLRLLPLPRIDVTTLHKEYFIHVHGSVILQTILDFQRPAKAVNSLLELSPEQLSVILCDAKGCHVTDALCRGQCVGVKARDKLIWRMKGLYQKLALSQYGSRAFEQIFTSATPEQRVKIMTEISDKSSLLNGSQYGRLIADKYDVNTFKSHQKQWEDKWGKKVLTLDGK